ncbi:MULTISPECIES: lytic transglycosylase domain-containing protein [Klebsiella pneumoniae complex]|uniref:lytic transglycosylase domain-containing protein n=1 Tax=Klebsiella pneumoniae complex TaxID=3390273 RepID=UPI000C796423|nr:MULTISPECIES: lytic transglycosylase domain-containing protein [Klebsiella]EFT1919736.1 lytic transglycosylase domain-containing protein [Escherichia coli]HDS3538492.1 lytic transglycosylase domain-containing protein [Klebsiella quasipneumoniae subsp. similipneumoniae]EHP7221159.1 lytic transglycosylase domain-containing protein [Escherichia coli]PLE62464.1 lytic transglycosylase [Klebsiella pneumoniae]SVM78223.1 lytic transglycosylase, catalytic [Klebsiella pneumoniae]
MNAETLKDFLISLGFKVDEAGARKFDAVVAGTTLKAIELGVKVEAAALSVVAFTAKIASGLDDLYWASQRTGATVEGIKQIGYAVSQVGGSVDGARGSLENLARFMRNNPGAEGFLNRLGVQTRDASGNMRDMATIFTGVGQRLSSMPYYRANQYAQMLGLDENTLMAMRRGIGQFSGEYTAMAKAIGYNADVAAVSSNKFMTSLRSFGLMAGMARDKIGSSLADGLAGSLDRLRRQILENFPKIEGAITAGVKGVLWFGEIIGRVVYRLIQLTGDIINWWKSLGTETRQVIEVFGALMIAWRLLNSAFAMSPIGRVIMLGAALIGLYDDYRTWKEGGQSLIDWGKWEPGIKYAQKAFASLSKDFGGIYVKVKDLGSAIVDLGKRFLEFINIDTSKFNGKWLFDQIIESVRSSIKILGSLVDALRKVISGDFSGAWDSLKGAAAAWSDSPVIQGAASVGQGLWDKAVDWWNGDATQYGQSVKRPSPSKAGAQLLGWMAPMMGKLEAMYNLPSGLLRSVAITESGGNQFAVSGAGAQGMFQFMPGTARDMGLRGNDVFDPIKSAEAAARYLSMLLQKNGGDLGKALASYNWGIGNVQKYGMALMPQETRQYIPKVLSNMPGAGAQVQQQNTYHIYGGNAQEIGREVSRQVDEKAQALGRNQAGMG